MTLSGSPDLSQGLCLWFTGRPCAGKSTIALHLAQNLESTGRRVTILDADVVRPILCPDLRYSRQDRLQSLSRLAFVAHELVRQGVLVLAVTIAPFEEHRRWLRQQFAAECFIQVYIKASLEMCERRDVKGMYRKARAHQLSEFTGIESSFEEPICSEIVCDTERLRLDACVRHIRTEISTRSWLCSKEIPV